MIKQLTKDIQFSTLGNIYMTEDELYRLIDVKTLNKLLKQRQSKVMLEDMQKQLDVTIPKLQEANSEIKKLKEELVRKNEEIFKLKNTSTEETSSENKRLREELASKEKELSELKSISLNEKRSNSTMKAREKSIELRSKKSRELASFILASIVKGISVDKTRNIASSYFGKDIKIATIYRALSVREDKDRERVLNLYADFPEEFSGVSEQELIQWFETSRIKKLHLVSKEDFISKYGETALPEKDKYITTEAYYSTNDM